MALVSRVVEQHHKSLLIKLCECMDPNDTTYRHFISYLGSLLPLGILSSKQQSPIDVLALMEERGFLKAGKYQDLAKALDVSGYKKLLDHLKKEEEFINRQMRKRSYDDCQRAVGSFDVETPIKKRPQSDGLRSLKNQTEDKLNTVKQLGYIPTKQGEKAKKLLEDKRSIVIQGNPGEGKTTTALQLIDNEIYSDRRVVVYCPDDWKVVDTQWVGIVILEDIFGHFDLDLGRLQEWLVYLPTIQEHVDAGKLRVIITTRVDILPKACSMLESIKLFSDDLSLTLTSEQLQNSEKKNILSTVLQRHEKNMNEDQMETCIANFSGLIGFPQSCSLFAADSNLFHIGPEFFVSPTKFFIENISKLKATRFLSLAFLFCNGEIYEEHLLLGALPESRKNLLMELASCLSIKKRKISATLLRDTYDSFLGLYVVKSISYESRSRHHVAKPSLSFSHAVVCEAVGHVLGCRCPQAVVKYGNSEYLYHRIDTAKAKERASQNMLITVSVYDVLAERMVNDVVQNGLVETVSKHSVLKQHQFVMKLKDQLRKGNVIEAFLMKKSDHKLDCLEGKCVTFLQHVLQGDKDVVQFVYSKFLEFLVCKHSNKTPNCWQCNEKQNLLELALYYHHFEIADKLIAMKACYTHTCLCNAARHGQLRRVKIILDHLKRSKVFIPVYYEAKVALCRAYISGHKDVIEFFLKEGITLDSNLTVYIVNQGNMNALIKFIEHLKCHNNWNPHLEKDWSLSYFSLSVCSFKHTVHQTSEAASSIALYMAYCNEKFDMADYLLKNKVKVSMKMLVPVLENSSQQAVTILIQSLKDAGMWDSICSDASEALEIAYRSQKYNVCDLLIQEGVTLTMSHLPGVILGTLDGVRAAVQQLKNTDNWNPNCNDAFEALEIAYCEQEYDVCDMLIQEGVSITMRHLIGFIKRFLVTTEPVQKAACTKAIQYLKDANNWDPKCSHASEALAYFFSQQKFDVCDLLVQEGATLVVKNLHDVLWEPEASFESVSKTIQYLKDIDIWDPKCDDAIEALQIAHFLDQYDVCDLLALEGVSLTMKFLYTLCNTMTSFESIKKAIQHLKETDSWDPKCNHASEALQFSYTVQNYDLCDTLVHEGISLTMKNLPDVIFDFMSSDESVRKAIQHLKETDSWDPKCNHASKALEHAYSKDMADVCDMLVQEGVSLTMKNLSGIFWWFVSSECVMKVIQHLKNNHKMDPACADASEALGKAYSEQKYDVCDLLIQEGVSLTMKNLLNIIMGLNPSFECIKKAIQHLKDTEKWDPKYFDGSRAFKKAYNKLNYDVRSLLVQEGVMKNHPRYL